MEKKLITNDYISKAADLITTREKTRTGFISMALEKNYLALPFIEEAKVLKSLASSVNEPLGLLRLKDIQGALLTASGLSEKAINYLTEEDKLVAINGLIDEFLTPAGDCFVDELVYRYLLIKGDALGGKARNLAGALGERKYLRSMISFFKVMGIPFSWLDRDSKKWLAETTDDGGIEKRMGGLCWTIENKNRILLSNITVPIVRKNVDLVLLDGDLKALSNNYSPIIKQSNRYIALGELKGGIDPAGADEHWKTANSALGRVRTAFGEQGLTPNTFFIGAAIENAMAEEIYTQLKNGTLSNAANLCYEEQLLNVCNWLLTL